MVLDLPLPAPGEETGQTSVADHLDRHHTAVRRDPRGHLLAQIPKGAWRELEGASGFLSHTCRELGRQLLPDFILLSVSFSFSVS